MSATGPWGCAATDGADEDGAEVLEGGTVAADQEAAGALPEEGFLGLGAALAQVFDVRLAADAAGDRRLGDGDGRRRRRGPS